MPYTNPATASRQPVVENACYGASKALVNWYGIRINMEDEWLNAFVLDPGYSTTDMGAVAARHYGHPDEALITPGEAVDGMFQVLQTTTKEKHGGKFVYYTGQLQDW